MKGYKYAELSISSVPQQLADDIKNISANLGVSYSTFLKMELRKIVNAIPDHMKKPPTKD